MYYTNRTWLNQPKHAKFGTYFEFKHKSLDFSFFSLLYYSDGICNVFVG